MKLPGLAAALERGAIDEVRESGGVAERANRLPALARTVWKNSGLVLGLLDAGVVMSAFLIAYYVRFHVPFASLKAMPAPDPAVYLKGAAFLACLWVFFIWKDGGYETGLGALGAPALGARSLVLGGVWALLVLTGVSFMFHVMLSRQVYLTSGLGAMGGMFLVRMLWRSVLEDVAKRWGEVQRVVIVGSGGAVEDIEARLREAGPGLIRIVGRIGSEVKEDRQKGGAEFLGGLGEIIQVWAKTKFDTVILTLGMSPVRGDDSRDRIMNVLNFCEQNGLALYSAPDSYHVAVKQTDIRTAAGTALIRLQDASINPTYAILKRVIDVVTSIVILVLGLPIWTAVAIMIKLDSPGPVLFSQIRAGRNGRPFKMYKFRTMVCDAEKQLRQLVDLEALKEPVFKIRNDPRVTKLGKFLRRYGIDEIPQLLNVIKGDMSLIGPRPEEMNLVSRYDVWQRRRLKAKPGITGLQQITNRGEPNLGERIKYDLIYLKHQGLLLDLYIAMKTIWVAFRGVGVT